MYRKKYFFLVVMLATCSSADGQDCTPSTWPNYRVAAWTGLAGDSDWHNGGGGPQDSNWVRFTETQIDFSKPASSDIARINNGTANVDADVDIAALQVGRGTNGGTLNINSGVFTTDNEELPGNLKLCDHLIGSFGGSGTLNIGPNAEVNFKNQSTHVGYGGNWKAKRLPMSIN